MQRHFNGAKNIILSPDGELWLLPWAALPASVDRFLTEEYGLQFVISGRDLIAPRDDRALSRSAPLILADPDFDAPIGGEPVKAIAGVSATGQLGDAPVHFAFGFDGSVVIRLNDATGDVIGRGAWSLDGTRLRFETERSAYEGEWSGRQVAGRRTIKDQPNRAADPWSFAMPSPPPVGATGERSLSQDANAIPPVARLPFTAIEAEIATDKLAQYLGAKPRIETDATATEAVFKTAVRPRIVMLATHGFYLPTQKLIVTDTGAPGAESPGPAKTADGKDRESPLVRCGILLAGCNRRHGLKPGADDGILTGLEIVSTDLRGCELIVLSACETGLGEVMVGEGVAGLRQAFQLAGAESIIASLWQVPDRDTALMMSRFYDAMAKGAAKAEALRSAQKAQIEMRRKRFGAAHPYFWAAFTLTGRSSALAAK
jgi:CHAT domain-containing protein